MTCRPGLPAPSTLGTSAPDAALLDVPILLDRPFLDMGDVGMRSTKDELQATVDAYEECKAAAARGEGDAWELMRQRAEASAVPPAPAPAARDPTMVDPHKASEEADDGSERW